MGVRFLFVVGSPRSGTTLAGSLAASASSIYNAGEYHAFYITRSVIPAIMRRIPSPLRVRYVQEVIEHARHFATKCASEAGARTFCDASPWNLLVANSLRVSPPDSVFLLCARHPAGVIQSLAQSYASGYHWAGRSLEERARLYARFYESASVLPEHRTAVFDYDAFCLDPEEELTKLTKTLGRLLDEDPGAFDWHVSATSHAPNKNSRDPIGRVDNSGKLEFFPRPPYDASAWTQQMDVVVNGIVAKGLAAIRRLRPTVLATSDLRSR